MYKLLLTLPKIKNKYYLALIQCYENYNYHCNDETTKFNYDDLLLCTIYYN